MSETKHTPGKLRYDVMGSDGCRIFPDTGDKHEDIKFVAMVNGRDLPTDTAIAARLCLCWNTHEELLEALKLAVQELCANADRGKCGTPNHQLMLDAIAKAEGITK